MNEDLAKIKASLDALARKKEADNARELIDQFSVLVANIPDDIAEKVAPVLQESLESSGQSIRDLLSSLIDTVSALKLNPTIQVSTPEVKIPEIRVPDVHIPEIKVPKAEVTVTIPEIPQPKVTVNVPEIKIPEIKIPKIEMPDSMTVDGEVSLKGTDLNNPLSVQIRDKDGNPIDLSSIGSQGWAGGKADFFTISDIRGSTISMISDTEGALRITGTVSTTGSAGTTSTNIITSDGNTYDARDRNWTITETVPISSGSTLQVIQVSGSNWSTTASQTGTWTVQPGNTQNTTPWLVGESNLFVNVTGANTSTVIKSGAGVLHTLTINTRGTGSAAALFDDIYGQSGNTIGSIDTTLSTTAFLFDVAFTNGLTLVTSGASGANLTISYR